jgi:hypothetical protein
MQGDNKENTFNGIKAIILIREDTIILTITRLYFDGIVL